MELSYIKNRIGGSFNFVKVINNKNKKSKFNKILINIGKIMEKVLKKMLNNK